MKLDLAIYFYQMRSIIDVPQSIDVLLFHGSSSITCQNGVALLWVNVNRIYLPRNTMLAVNSQMRGRETKCLSSNEGSDC